jgi:hypothetical protein
MKAPLHAPQTYIKCKLLSLGEEVRQENGNFYSRNNPHYRQLL